MPADEEQQAVLEVMMMVKQQQQHQHQPGKVEKAHHLKGSTSIDAYDGHGGKMAAVEAPPMTKVSGGGKKRESRDQPPQPLQLVCLYIPLVVKLKMIN
jgi:hypothetical protein